MKEKLVLLFTDHQADKILNEHEIKACLEFMQKYVKPFQSNRMKRDILNVMLRKSQIIELTSDELPFSHNLEQNDDLGNNDAKNATMSHQQYFYNKYKKASMALGINKEPKALMFQAVPEGSPGIEKEDDYKPKLLNANEIHLDMENGTKTGRSNTSLIPGEGGSNPINSLKGP